MPKPAASLQGLTLNNGWNVIEHIKKIPERSGGFFSESYIVKKGDQLDFMKALDFSPAFDPDVDTMKMLNSMTSSYEHERDVLQLCAELRLSNVVVAIDHGHTQAPGFEPIGGRVFYLIFELADGDVRGQVTRSARLNTLWCLFAIRDVSLGLWQVHRQMVAHQDTKPSNVLIYKQGKDRFRIADFGRSSLKGKPAEHDGSTVAGDKGYSPPELLYGFTHPDFNARRFGCDMYMLGNLFAFMLTGVNITKHIFSRLDPQFHPSSWQGTYQQALPYIQRLFSDVLADIEANIEPLIKEKSISAIRELCNPDLSKRGYPKTLGRPDQFSLERYVSIFNFLSQKFEIHSSVSEEVK